MMPVISYFIRLIDFIFLPLITSGVATFRSYAQPREDKEVNEKFAWIKGVVEFTSCVILREGVMRTWITQNDT